MAACLTAEDFGFEVGFQHKDGGETRVSLAEDVPGAMTAEYRDRYGEPLRWTWALHGVYPAGEQVNLSVDPAAGATTPWPMEEISVQTVFEGAPPWPKAGVAWQGRGVDSRTDAEGAKDWAFDARYSFDAARVVTLSGCEYRTVGVNATFTAEGAEWAARWVYFPEFDVAVQTKGRDSRTGADWANGLVGVTP